MRRIGLAVSLSVCVGAVMFPAIGRSQSESAAPSSVIPVSGQLHDGVVGPTLPTQPTSGGAGVADNAVSVFAGVSGKGGDSDDGRVEVRRNADGSKTAKIAVSDVGLLGSDGVVKRFSSGLAKKDGRWVPGLVGDSVSFGLASDDGGGVLSVGGSGRSVRFGAPSATAFSGPKREAGDGKVVGLDKPVGCNGGGVWFGGEACGLCFGWEGDGEQNRVRWGVWFGR